MFVKLPAEHAPDAKQPRCMTWEEISKSEGVYGLSDGVASSSTRIIVLRRPGYGDPVHLYYDAASGRLEPADGYWKRHTFFPTNEGVITGIA